MKKIALFVALVFLSSGVLMAQKSVSEQDVKVSFVKDFQRQVKNATKIAWWQIDENTYKVTYLDEEKARMAMVFSNKGMETHYFIEDNDYYPHAIVEYVKTNLPDFSITDLWVRKARGKTTYQARIARMGGFLWWKSEKEVQILNFEIDGKFIDE